MKRLTLKLSTLVVALSSALYLGYFYITPSITIVNNSGQALIQSMVKLPNSNLDFGVIGHDAQNTIYYSVEQQDGSYRYFFNIGNTKNVQGECGDITNNEIHKRVIMQIDQNQQVTCSS